MNFRVCNAAMLAMLLMHALAPLAGYGQAARERDPLSRMQSRLEAKLSREPQHSDSWRLLAKIHRKRGDNRAAWDALQNALRWDGDNVAAHADIGAMLYADGRRDDAIFHFRRVWEIDPEGNYARELPPEVLHALQSPVVPVGYEVTRFDGSDEFHEQQSRVEEIVRNPLLPPSPIVFFMEAGLQYNTNVTLTPISQELRGNGAEGFQAFITPDFEYRLLNTEKYRHGPKLGGYFNVNDRDFGDFDLASYEGGYFLERTDVAPVDDIGLCTLIWRAEYLYTLDTLGGDQFGDRHKLTLSGSYIEMDGDVLYFYYSLKNNNFVDDGRTPAVNSLDGVVHTLGVSQFLSYNWPMLRSISLGADLESADTEGSDFAYNSISLYADAVVPLTARTDFVLEGGWGYRDYHRFTGAPSRDEHVWRAGARLRTNINDYWSISGVVSYDRFDSENDNFRAERWITGVTTTLAF